MASNILFITGTGTGVGKTVLTALLLCHLRRQGRRALAMKPFCSGPRGDAATLWHFQKGSLTLEEVNPFYSPLPLAPWAAARQSQTPAIALATARQRILALSQRCDILLVEGIGGVAVPLARDYTVGHLISTLGAVTLVAARNQIGTINHTLLTIKYLHSLSAPALSLVLMGCRRRDPSASTNPALLRQLLPSLAVFSLPYMGKRANLPSAVEKNEKKYKKQLQRILEVLF